MELASIVDLMVQALDAILLALLAYGACLSLEEGCFQHDATEDAAHPGFDFPHAQWRVL